MLICSHCKFIANSFAIGNVVTVQTLNIVTANFFVLESESVAESPVGASPGLPLTKRPVVSKSGSKPTIVTPLENVEINHGDNIVLQVNIQL